VFRERHMGPYGESLGAIRGTIMMGDRLTEGSRSFWNNERVEGGGSRKGRSRDEKKKIHK